jgi:hypothetical protein
MSIFELLQKHPIRGFRSGEDYSMAVRELLLRLGYTPVRASFDSAGNCEICGECGRCPGWHTQSEQLHQLETNN